ncbi:gluconokinase [Segetibacter aerophilus]|uniref:Gluconate kinase n=1 Tax=Segetibacter aerophilus TaxID=670293 RepID=A0A512BC31_9BACT|nr:gluconokinase [Segetibacter aerophilus]GEO09531.1 gluconate kinase [Segetibacter aerophilus]
MKYYLGIDIGTTSSKAVAFSETGQVVGDCSFPYQMHHPQTGWSEQDPEIIFTAVVNAINKVVLTLAPHLPIFISFSAAMHSLIAVDEKGKPLTQCIIWADNRSDLIAQKLRATEEGEQFYHSTGVPIHSMSPLCKLLWLRENAPEIFKTAFKFIGIKEFIFYKFFSQFVVDTSIASATGLLNSKSLQWDEEILNYVSITADRLSTVVSTKAIFRDHTFNGLTNIKEVPFVVGASDGALSNLGTGATGKAMAITIGTSGAARMIISQPKTDAGMRTFCYHLKDDLYVAGGANNNGAVVLQWLKESLLEAKEDYDELFEKAKVIKPGSDDLLFLPYILGERAPIWNANAKGVFFGLNVQHTKAHMVRASLEGVIFSMYSIISILAQQHEVSELHGSGGFAKSPLWVQMLADISGLKVLVSDTVESSALGAVMLGAEALGIETILKFNIISTYEPDGKNHQVYQKQFEKFERLYQLLKGEMVNEEMRKG